MSKDETPPTRRRRPNLGFTLLELLVVLAILSLIAAVAAPQAMKWLGGAKSDAARVQIENLSAVIDLYKLEVGTYPPSLEALVEKPAGADRWNGPYLKKESVPKDPWGRDYVYRLPGEHGPYDLLSLGDDGSEGGDGENRDIVSWQ
ncbi:MAG: type II secretion system major pseudopilin GspG [Ectothiorhodospiraceae bacterium]|nr:type II secretion system major pseudopilin GspG [Chromatiales bacterium]MCP5155328.1 type II secretion system major pseudopilin GspG [Ectothiorhodospiraceae bacterium]